MKTRKCIVLAVTACFLMVAVSFMSGTLLADTKEKPKTVRTGDAVKGKEILTKVIDALGGAEKMKAIKNYEIKMHAIRVTDTELVPMDAIAVLQYPDKLYYKIWSRLGIVIMTVDGDKGWQMLPPARKLSPMAPQNVKGQASTIYRDIIYICKNIDKNKIEYLGEKKWYGRKVLELKITGDMVHYLYVNPKDYLPLGGMYEQTMLTRPEPVKQEELYFDYKVVDGLNWPHRAVLKADGHVMMGYTINAFQFNVQVGKDFFKGL